MVLRSASRPPRAHYFLLLALLACVATGVMALTQAADREAPTAAGPVAAAAKHRGRWSFWGGHSGGHQQPNRPTQIPTNLDDPKGKACLWTPGVLQYSNDAPNATRIMGEKDFYFQDGGCAEAELVAYFPREAAACRACHAATTRRACLALQADNESNALNMTCMWRGPQPQADTRHHSQPKPTTLEARWSVGINEPSGFIYRLADDTCFVTAELEADARSAALFQARLGWILYGPARTPNGNTPSGLNNEAVCAIYGNKRKCSLTIPRAAWSKILWMTNMITTKNPAVIANLATVSNTCYEGPYYEQNCATAYSFEYTMRLTEHPCQRGTSPRFAAASRGSWLMFNYAAQLQPGKERIQSEVVVYGWFPLLGGKAARWSFSWGRSPTLSPVVALVNTTSFFRKACTQDSNVPDLYNCDLNKLKPLTVGGRWCTKRTCADQILSMPQLNGYSVFFSPYTKFAWNDSDSRYAHNPSQTPPVELTYNDIKVWG